MTTTITRDLLKTLRSDLDTAFAEIGKKHGLALSIGTIRFDATTGSARLSFAPTGAITNDPQGSAIGQAVVGDATPKEQLAAVQYAKLCKVYNLHPDWLGKQFNMQGSQFTLVGLQPNRSKNCCVIKRVSTGKTFVCPPESIHRAFAG